jgi:hypothetical protein
MPTVKQWRFSMPQKVHPCLCGFIARNHGQSVEHRAKCPEWKNRPDPRGLALHRRSETWKENAQTRSGFPCPVCGGTRKEHKEGCPHNLEERVRLEKVRKAGIHPDVWAKFLEVFAKSRQRPV